MDIKDYKDLIVWQKERALVTEVYKLTRLLPKEELFALSSQMQRAAISIPSNIAEGSQRKGINEYIHFLSIARGSNAELQTQLFICNDLGYLSEEQTASTLSLSYEIGKMLNSLMAKLNELTPNT